MITTLPLAVTVIAAVVGLVGERRPALRVGAATIAVAGIAAAAITGALTDPVVGVGRAVCLTLVVLASAVGGTGFVPVLFDVVGTEHRLRRHSPTDTGDFDDADLPANEDDSATPGPIPLRGGRIIGVLERVAVTVTVLAGWPEGVAVVLAVKGLARYPEIRDQHAGEQFIIGTFGSVLWAVAAAGVGRLVLT